MFQLGRLTGFGRRRDFSAAAPDPFPSSRYFRLTITQWSVAGTPCTSGDTRIAEMELGVGATTYPSGVMTGPSAPSPLVATASDSNGSFPPWRAFDGVLGDSNRWISTTTGTEHWLQIDLGVGNEISPNLYRLAPDSAGSSGYYPTAWTLAGSNTGSFSGEETIFDTQVGVTTGWAGSTLRQFTTGAPAPLATPHRYWRIANVNLPGGTDLEISELQFFESAVNVTGDGTITSSVAPSSGAVTDLTDVNLSTSCVWTAAVAEALGFWIQMDFGAGDEKAIDGVKQGGFDTSNRYMESFTLQYSDDGATFFTYGSQKGLTYPGNNTLSSEYPFVPLTANRRYWRWLITANDGDTTYTSFAEVELRAVVSGADVIPTSSATASIESPDAANGGVDNSTNTEWVAQNNNVFPQWFQVDLGVSTDLSLAQSAMVSQRVIASGARTPTAWTIECSTDIVAWMAVDQQSGITWASAIETQLFTL